MPADANEIRRTLERLHEGRLIEIRAMEVPIGSNGRKYHCTVSGYFTDFQLAAEAAVKLEAAGAPGIYTLLNEPHPGLLARRPNQLEWGADKCTSENEIVSLCWSLIDLDVIRPTGISATDAEMKPAAEVGRQIRKLLEADGLEVLRACSGNGYHLLVKFAEETEDSVEQMLASMDWMSAEFSIPGQVNVDISVTKRAQLTKLYGTLVRKGHEVAGRRHRRSKLYENKS